MAPALQRNFGYDDAVGQRNGEGERQSIEDWERLSTQGTIYVTSVEYEEERQVQRQQRCRNKAPSASSIPVLGYPIQDVSGAHVPRRRSM
jgi:hypothetical protein